MTSKEIIEFMTGKRQEEDGQSIADSEEGGVSRCGGKEYRTICKAFEGVLVRDWLDTDENNLEQVMQSIANLRERIWETSRLLLEIKSIQDSSAAAGWKGLGYRGGRGKGCLMGEDLELALDHDLLQHERMLTGARRLLATMGQAQDALGRRLDELYHFAATTEGLSVFNDDDEDDYGERESRDFNSKLEECQSLFTATSNELYRKQMLAEEVLLSCNDYLLYSNSEEDEDMLVSTAGSEEEREGGYKNIYSIQKNPHQIAQRCADQWSRTSKMNTNNSYLYESRTILDNILDHSGT
jgi:hypothetical protein